MELIENTQLRPKFPENLKSVCTPEVSCCSFVCRFNSKHHARHTSATLDYIIFNIYLTVLIGTLETKEASHPESQHAIQKNTVKSSHKQSFESYPLESGWRTARQGQSNSSSPCSNQSEPVCSPGCTGWGPLTGSRSWNGLCCLSGGIAGRGEAMRGCSSWKEHHPTGNGRPRYSGYDWRQEASAWGKDEEDSSKQDRG